METKGLTPHHPPALDAARPASLRPWHYLRGTSEAGRWAAADKHVGLNSHL
jgi:hypothetical protein